jgi:hypothetical protein
VKLQCKSVHCACNDYISSESTPPRGRSNHVPPERRREATPAVLPAMCVAFYELNSCFNTTALERFVYTLEGRGVDGYG